MTTFTVIERPLKLEPITKDPFIESLGMRTAQYPYDREPVAVRHERQEESS